MHYTRVKMVLLCFILQPFCFFNWFTFWDIFPISCFLDVSCPSLLILAFISFFHIIISLSNPLPTLQKFYINYLISFTTDFATLFSNWAFFKVNNSTNKSLWMTVIRVSEFCLFFSFLLARLRTATLRHDDEGQASFILCRSDTYEVSFSVT